ncbi:MAG: hypothetical protein WBN72_11670 [Nitrososphaeraceae archaeon]
MYLRISDGILFYNISKLDDDIKDPDLKRELASGQTQFKSLTMSSFMFAH